MGLGCYSLKSAERATSRQTWSSLFIAQIIELGGGALVGKVSEWQAVAAVNEGSSFCLHGAWQVRKGWSLRLQRSAARR